MKKSTQVLGLTIAASAVHSGFHFFRGQFVEGLNYLGITLMMTATLLVIRAENRVPKS